MAEDNKNFLTSLPGILTGIAAVITAVVTLWVTINSNKPDHTTVDPKAPVPQNSQQAELPKDTTKPATQPPGQGSGTDAQSGNQPVQPSEESASPAKPLILPGKLIPLNPLLVRPLAVIPLYNLTAVINDPDGFTNVRSMKSSTSEIVAIIRENERFYTYKQNDNWWQVKTASGKIGYVHVSRIKLLPNP
jgi:uncharacterized protein YgiM (DUF1202 family)